MKTDKQLFKVFNACPDLLEIVINTPKRDTYHLESMTFKELERRVDGVMIPEDETEPCYVVEFQARRDKTIYYRWISGMTMMGEKNPDRLVFGALIFLTEAADPKTEPWSSLAKVGNPGFRVVYLLKELNALMPDMPDHPAFAALAPILVDDDRELQKRAPDFYRQLKQSGLNEQRKNDLIAVLISWIGERFKDKTAREVWAMLEKLTPFEETRMYQELLEHEKIGEKRGEARGRLNMLKIQLDQGIIDKKQYHQLLDAYIKDGPE